MWHEGTIGIPVEGGLQPHHFWVKSFEKASKYGIEGGRISKLFIKRGSEVVCSYDRGWGIKPKDKAAKQAMAILMADYN